MSTVHQERDTKDQMKKKTLFLVGINQQTWQKDVADHCSFLEMNMGIQQKI